jgi:hypothetical protein
VLTDGRNSSIKCQEGQSVIVNDSSVSLITVISSCKDCVIAVSIVKLLNKATILRAYADEVLGLNLSHEISDLYFPCKCNSSFSPDFIDEKSRLAMMNFVSDNVSDVL